MSYISTLLNTNKGILDSLVKLLLTLKYVPGVENVWNTYVGKCLPKRVKLRSFENFKSIRKNFSCFDLVK